jgi:transposase InsO family protein
MTQVRSIAYYIAATDPSCRRLLKNCQPGPGFLPFSLKGYNNGDPAPPPPEGDMVTEAEVSWELVHKKLVQIMTERGILDSDRARMTLKNLCQGSADAEVYGIVFRHWTSIAHPGVATEQFKAEFIDGLAKTNLPVYRASHPHVCPIQLRMQSMLKAGTLDGLTFDEILTRTELEQADIRREMNVLPGVAFAPFVSGQAAVDPTTNAVVQQSTAAPSNTSTELAINAVAGYNPKSLSMDTAITSLRDNDFLTVKDFMMARLEMEAGQARNNEKMEAKIDQVASETQQNTASVKEMSQTIHSVERLLAKNADQMHELALNVTKLVENSATQNRNARRPFNGNCHNCKAKGHMARDCDQPANKMAINAVLRGELKGTDFEEQYGDHSVFINCLSKGIPEDDASGPDHQELQNSGVSQDLDGEANGVNTEDASGTFTQGASPHLKDTGQSSDAPASQGTAPATVNPSTSQRGHARTSSTDSSVSINRLLWLALSRKCSRLHHVARFTPQLIDLLRLGSHRGCPSRSNKNSMLFGVQIPTPTTQMEQPPPKEERRNWLLVIQYRDRTLLLPRIRLDPSGGLLLDGFCTHSFHNITQQELMQQQWIRELISTDRDGRARLGLTQHEYWWNNKLWKAAILFLRDKPPDLRPWGKSCRDLFNSLALGTKAGSLQHSEQRNKTRSNQGDGLNEKMLNYRHLENKCLAEQSATAALGALPLKLRRDIQSNSLATSLPLLNPHEGQGTGTTPELRLQHKPPREKEATRPPTTQTTHTSGASPVPTNAPSTPIATAEDNDDAPVVPPADTTPTPAQEVTPQPPATTLTSPANAIDIIMMTSRCTSCSSDKPLTDFGFSLRDSSKRLLTCSNCLNKRQATRLEQKSLDAPTDGDRRKCAYSHSKRGCLVSDFDHDAEGKLLNTCRTHTTLRREKAEQQKEAIEAKKNTERDALLLHSGCQCRSSALHGCCSQDRQPGSLFCSACSKSGCQCGCDACALGHIEQRARSKRHKPSQQARDQNNTADAPQNSEQSSPDVYVLQAARTLSSFTEESLYHQNSRALNQHRLAINTALVRTTQEDEALHSGSDSAWATHLLLDKTSTWRPCKPLDNSQLIEFRCGVKQECNHTLIPFNHHLCDQQLDASTGVFCAVCTERLYDGKEIRSGCCTDCMGEDQRVRDQRLTLASLNTNHTPAEAIETALATADAAHCSVTQRYAELAHRCMMLLTAQTCTDNMRTHQRSHSCIESWKHNALQNSTPKSNPVAHKQNKLAAKAQRGHWRELLSTWHHNCHTAPSEIDNVVHNETSLRIMDLWSSLTIHFKSSSENNSLRHTTAHIITGSTADPDKRLFNIQTKKQKICTSLDTAMDGIFTKNTLLSLSTLLFILLGTLGQDNRMACEGMAITLGILAIIGPKLGCCDLTSGLASVGLAALMGIFMLVISSTAIALCASAGPLFLAASSTTATAGIMAHAVTAIAWKTLSDLLPLWWNSCSPPWTLAAISVDALIATQTDKSLIWSATRIMIKVLTWSLDGLHGSRHSDKIHFKCHTEWYEQWHWLLQHWRLALRHDRHKKDAALRAMTLILLGLLGHNHWSRGSELAYSIWPVFVAPMANLVIQYTDRRWQHWLRRRNTRKHQQVVIQANATTQQDFHAATIKVWLPQEGKALDMLVDLGAASSVMKRSSLIRGVQRGLKRISNSIKLVAANGLSVGSLLGTTSVEMQFTAGGPSLHHVTSVIDNERMPDILGVDFFSKYQADISFATKSLSLLVNGDRIEVPFIVNGKSWEDDATVCATRTQQTAECMAEATTREQLVLLPGFYAHVACDVKHPSDKLHCSQSFVVESLLKAECRVQTENDIESQLKPLVGVLRAIPRALVAPRWDTESGTASVILRVENRGTETLHIRAGQSIASLSEFDTTPTACNDIASLEELQEAGLTPMQMARLGNDAGILGTDDWRTGLSGKKIVEKILSQNRPELDPWMEKAENKLEFGESLKPDERLELTALAFAFKDIFSNSAKPGLMRGVEFGIDFKAPFTQAFKERVRRCSPLERLAQIKETRTMLKAGVIRRSDSPWASNVVMVKKKDGNWRFCVDWRRLNSLIKKDAFPLPRIDDSLDRLQGAQRFTTFDISQAFWCIPCKQEHQQYTAFNTPLGLMEFTRMGFGLCNSSAVFQRSMQAALGDLSHEMCLLYIDDGLIFSSAEDHLDAVAAVLKRLAHSGCTLKVSKCAFGCQSVEFLGHEVIAGEGVCVRKAKVAAIARTKPPATAADVKTFLGMAGFFRRFIPNFATIAAPLRAVEKQMTSKSQQLGHLWRPNVEQRCFDAIKAALVNFTVLAFPDFDKPFLVLCDSSHRQMGAALIQLDDEGHPRPIAFASSSLDAAQRRYGISDKEGLCVVWATRLWRHYLHGSKTLVATDHSALTALTSKRDFPNARLARYALDLSEFDLEITHRPGRFHFLPDWLSRADLLDMQADEILQTEIDRLLALHKYNEAGLLKADLKALKKATHCIADEVLYGADSLGTPEADFADSVVFAPGRVQQGIEQLMKKGNNVEARRRRDLLFARTISTSPAVSAEDDWGEHEDQSLSAQLKHLQDDPVRVKPPSDDTMASRAMHVYEHVCALANVDDDSDNEPDDDGAGMPFPIPATAPYGQATSNHKAALTEECPLQHRIHEAQSTDLFAVAMRSYLRSEHGSLPKDEILRLDVLRLCSSYVLDDQGWLFFIKEVQDKSGDIGNNKLRLYVPPGLRGEVLIRIHEEAGHPGHLRSAQLAALHFYWPNMFADARRLLNYCIQCKSRASRNTKAVMQGHIQADSAGEVWVLDVLRLEKTDEGHHFLLCAVDVFSRYGVVEKIPAATAQLAARAFKDRILTICKPKLVITDGGSEFKSVFKDSLTQLGIEHHVTTACHSEGHGLIERFNRSFTKTLSHSLKGAPKMDWPDHLGAALTAYNCIPHSAHGLVPLQVFFDTVDRTILPISREAGGISTRQGRESTLEMIEARRAMKDTVAKNLAQYHAKQSITIRELKRTVRSLNIGDTVLVFRETGSKLKDKWNDRFDGPFVILAKEGMTKYLVQRIGSDEKHKWEHVDNLIAAPILPQAVSFNEHTSREVAGHEPPAPTVVPTMKKTHNTGKDISVSKKKFEVETIMGKDSIEDKYLVKWKGYDIATWEPTGNLDCSKLIRSWEELSGRDQRNLRKSANTGDKNTVIASVHLIPLSTVVNTTRTTHFISTDLSKLKHGSMINYVCAKLGIHPSQILFTWASPDCRTYSRANTSNITRNNEYRNHKLDAHPPKDRIDSKRMMAIQHDLLIQSLLESFTVTQASDPDALFVMENPSASLRRRTFVRIFETLIGLTCHLVHYCAFAALVKKPSDIWTNIDWSPTGTTGDGHCHRKCSAGSFTRINGKSSFRHPESIAGTAERAPKGTLATSIIPALLHEEILDAAIRHHVRRGGDKRRTYVVELFAGSTQLGVAVRRRGLSYVAVDMSSISAKCFYLLHGETPS